VTGTEIPDEARRKAAGLIDRLSEAADFNWGTHYPCLRDDLGDLVSDLQSGKTSPTIEQIVDVVAQETRVAQIAILREWILDINLRRYETPEQIAKAMHVRMEWLKTLEEVQGDDG
jgi:hypothetical protein